MRLLLGLLLLLGIGGVFAADPAPGGSTPGPTPDAAGASTAGADVVEPVHPGRTAVAGADCTACHKIPTLAAPKRTGSCVTCHEWIRSTSATPAVREKAMSIFPKWARYERNVKSYFAVPDLGVSFARLDPAWVATWLADPHDLRPDMDETMVRVGLDAQALADVAAWGGTFNVPVPRTPRSKKKNVAEGARIFEARACGICHTFGAHTGSNGIPPAPDLRWARERLTDDMIVAWILDPHAIAPGAMMPTLGVSREEAIALRDFLVLGEPGGTAPPPIPPADTVPAPTWVNVEARVIGKICIHCHMDPAQNEGRAGPGNAGGFGWAATGIELQTYEGVVANGPAIVAALRRRQAEEARDHVQAGQIPATITRPALPGMPLGLPAIPEADIQMVEAWIAAGAPR